MKRLRVLILIFCFFLSVPLGYFILRTHQSLDQEERAELRYFADTLFFEMEKELADFVSREESREIDAYTRPSAISQVPKEPYILGYFQNNSDGAFQTPLAVVEGGAREADALQLNERVSALEADNRAFNSRRTDGAAPMEPRPPAKAAPLPEDLSLFAGKYLDASRSRQQKSVLGREEKRVEEITESQAQNLAWQDAAAPAARKDETTSREAESMSDGIDRDRGISGMMTQREMAGGAVRTGEMAAPSAAGALEAPSRGAVFRAEIDPMQSVFIGENEVVLFRRIVVGDRVFRQGAVLLLKEFADHLARTHFEDQPMAKFTRLRLTVRDRDMERTLAVTGAAAANPEFTLSRTFPRPFAFLTAAIACDRIPRSGGRQTLNIMMAVMGTVILMGLFAIYRSARAVADMSERRSRFVSSVTHELKTPLTNIRMYVEMLEQKIAPDPRREQDYFRILGSESTRLSRLINNVLEFSRLEKKNRRFEMAPGRFDEVIDEVSGIMQEKLRQEGFVLRVENRCDHPFAYDREAMVQVLVNLIENSVKFGRHLPEKSITVSLVPAGRWMTIRLSDTGPGIPRRALKKIFDDFFRVADDPARPIAGTGIGLALVRRFVQAMGGSVSAENNAGSGCTIIVSLPADVG